MSKVYVYFDKDDHPVAEGKSMADLAKKIGVRRSAICEGLKTGCRKYAVYDEEDEDE